MFPKQGVGKNQRGGERKKDPWGTSGRKGTSGEKGKIKQQTGAVMPPS